MIQERVEAGLQVGLFETEEGMGMTRGMLRIKRRGRDDGSSWEKDSEDNEMRAFPVCMYVQLRFWKGAEVVAMKSSESLKLEKGDSVGAREKLRRSPTGQSACASGRCRDCTPLAGRERVGVCRSQCSARDRIEVGGQYAIPVCSRVAYFASSWCEVEEYPAKCYSSPYGRSARRSET